MRAAFLVSLLIVMAGGGIRAEDEKVRPLMKDLIVLNGGVVLGGTEEQQAIWSLRSVLMLARLGVGRTYLPFFHAEATHRGGVPQILEQKPAFLALAWLQHSLGEYRFARVEREEGDCYAYEFVHGAQPAKRAWVVWRAAGEPHLVRLFNDPLRVIRAERMPLVSGPAEKVEVRQEIEGYMAVEAAERPVIIWLEKP